MDAVAKPIFNALKTFFNIDFVVGFANITFDLKFTTVQNN